MHNTHFDIETYANETDFPLPINTNGLFTDQIDDLTWLQKCVADGNCSSSIVEPFNEPIQFDVTNLERWKHALSKHFILVLQKQKIIQLLMLHVKLDYFINAIDHGFSNNCEHLHRFVSVHKIGEQIIRKSRFNYVNDDVVDAFDAIQKLEFFTHNDAIFLIIKMILKINESYTKYYNDVLPTIDLTDYYLLNSIQSDLSHVHYPLLFRKMRESIKLLFCKYGWNKIKKPMLSRTCLWYGSVSRTEHTEQSIVTIYMGIYADIVNEYPVYLKFVGNVTIDGKCITFYQQQTIMHKTRVVTQMDKIFSRLYLVKIMDIESMQYDGDMLFSNDYVIMIVCKFL